MPTTHARPWQDARPREAQSFRARAGSSRSSPVRRRGGQGGRVCAPSVQYCARGDSLEGITRSGTEHRMPGLRLCRRLADAEAGWEALVRTVITSRA
eukprot:1979589-Pyramimonas_sp.AAC.1